MWGGAIVFVGFISGSLRYRAVVGFHVMGGCIVYRIGIRACIINLLLIL